MTQVEGGRADGADMVHPVVRLSISPIPAHVRTARLVAVAAAREFGADASRLEEIKLAVSEACTRAIAATAGCEQPGLVGLSIGVSGVGDHTRITLVVSDRGPHRRREADRASDPLRAAVTASDVSAEASLLLTGMIDDVEIGPGPDGVGTVVRASWPIR